jgi:glycosyltransferase involved in cell wall biosynthesis
MSSDNPLVSIIVRTKDRPELLRRSLQSIAAQTYRLLEVVLVNDGGCDLVVEEFKSILGDISLNYIPLEKNSGRAHAGNVGIENVKGEYVGFLDDDDEFYPEHVETLTSFMNQSGCKVAYTGVAFVEEIPNGDSDQVRILPKRTFARDFSYDDLLIGNYIPLISLLFRADVLKNFMFDESFELYEDWDMLIRTGEVMPFYFIKRITAVYNQRDDSQIAFKSSPEVLREATVKLYEKHRTRFPLGIVFTMREELYGKDCMIAQREERLRELEARINNLGGVVDDLKNVLQEKDAYIQSINATRGWRVLARYYKIKERFLRLIR